MLGVLGNLLFIARFDIRELAPGFSLLESLQLGSAGTYLFADLLFRVASFLHRGPKLYPLMQLYGSVAVFVHGAEQFLGVDLREVALPW